MRGVCWRSVRWHQQFVQSARVTGHQHCIQHLQPLRSYRQAVRGRRTQNPTSSSRHDDLVIHEYEQVEGHPETRTPTGYHTEMQAQSSFLQAKIKELEQELAQMKVEPFGVDSDLAKELPGNERKLMLHRLKEEGVLLQEEDLLDLDEIDRVLEQGLPEDNVDTTARPRVPLVTMRIPQRQKNYVKRFNKALRAAVESDLGEEERLQLWAWYLRCQQQVSGFSRIVSEDVWQILWDSQTKLFYRPQHVAMLAKDMLDARSGLSRPQWVTYIEALRETKDIGTAIRRWEEQRSSIGPDSELATEFYTLGVEMYTGLGRLQAAEELVEQCLQHSDVVSPRLYIPLITAWANSKVASAGQHAWACYLNLRAQQGNQITAEVYMSISTKLLAAGRKDMALAVFKDLMLAMQTSKYDSFTIFEQTLGQSTSTSGKRITAAQINSIALSTLNTFPRKFNNKYFFGAWLKQLLGARHVDSAASVIELMYERGVKLDAKHLNGIVAAWLREGSKSAQQKAEQLAWAMVHCRVDLVEARGQAAAHHSALPDGSATKESLVDRSRVPVFLRRAAPAANIETFSILLLYYTRRSDMASAEHLTRLMETKAQIKPNSFIMNHWLYAALRSGDIRGLWERYSSLKHDIRPDLETFAALWDAARVQYDSTRSAKSDGFPNARSLFKEMCEWLESILERERAKAQSEFSRELFDQILRCFCLSADLPGMIAALHGLEQRFAAYPQDNTIQMGMVQVAKMLPRHDIQKSAGRWRGRRSMSWERQAFNKVAEIVDTILESRTVNLRVQQNLGPEGEIDEPDQDRLRLEVLDEFLVGIIRRIHPGSDPAKLVTEAANTIGVNVTEVDFGE